MRQSDACAVGTLETRPDMVDIRYETALPITIARVIVIDD